jgi:prophage tail gpP-like protein
MLASTLFIRVVPQDKDRGYTVLAGYDDKVVQRTAIQSTTLSVPTRASLDAAIARLKASNSAAEVRDVTAPAIVKKLAKLFGETPTQATAPAAATFSGLGIGSYIPTE